MILNNDGINVFFPSQQCLTNDRLLMQENWQFWHQVRWGNLILKILRIEEESGGSPLMTINDSHDTRCPHFSLSLSLSQFSPPVVNLRTTWDLGFQVQPDILLWHLSLPSALTRDWAQVCLLGQLSLWQYYSLGRNIFWLEKYLSYLCCTSFIDFWIQLVKVLESSKSDPFICYINLASKQLII